MLCNIADCPSLSFRSSSSFRSISNQYLLSSAHFCSISVYKNLTSMLQYEAKLRKNHKMTTKSELTCPWCTLAIEVSGRGRMGRVESVVRALSCVRLGVLAVSTKLLAIQYRSCFFPPPALMMASPESGAVSGSHVSTWSALPTSVYAVRRAGMLGFVYASGGAAGLLATSDVSLPM